MFLENVIGPARPVTWPLRFWPVLVAAFGASFGATYLCKRIALKFGIVDEPDHRVKTHKEPVAYLGGLGMLAGFTAAVLAGIAHLSYQPGAGGALIWFLGILLGAGIVSCVGLADDLFQISPAQKIIGQVAAGIILIIVGIVPNLDFLSIPPLNLRIPFVVNCILQYSIVIIFVVGATNSLNLLDGLDGLCAGVTAIITVAMFLLAVHLATWGASATGDPVRIAISLGLIGSVCGFLPFNRHPAKIFMGDAGSMLLGFVVAALMILFAEDIPRWWMASVVVFGLPILDTAVAVIRRLLNRRPLFESDRGHIYDQMIDRGIPLRKTVAICYLLSGFYAVVGVLMSQIRTRYAVVVYVLVFAVSGLIVSSKGYLKMRGLRGAIRQEDK